MKNYSPNWLVTTLSFGRSLEKIFLLQFFFLFISFSVLQATAPTEDKIPDKAPSSAAEMTACDNGRIFVDADAANNGDGIAWGSAYNKLQDALAEACACSNAVEIWVAAGTYYPDEDEGGIQTDNARSSSFNLCNNVALYGGFAGTETNRTERDFENNVTILSGDLQQDDSQQPIITDISTVTGTGNNAYTVVNGSGTNNTAIIDGFTVTAGNSDGGSGASSLGGGIYINNGSSSISNVSILGNNATDAGGIYIGASTSRPVLTDVQISGNRATFGGGGAYNSRGNIDMINVLISGNSARFGGGFWTGSSAYSDLINVSISGNNAPVAGGVYIEEASLNAVNVTISGNSADAGGGIYNNFGFIVLTNVIVWNNSHNGNTAIPTASIFNVVSTPTINNSIIANFAPSGSNKDVDPLFAQDVDPSMAPTTAGDLRLRFNSPAVDMGDNTADIDITGGTMTIADIATDIAGSPRIQQTTVDIGAYERAGCPIGLSDQVVYVDASNASPGDGSDWANAFDKLQDALTMACGCSEITEIWVAAGTYYPDEGLGYTDNDRSSTFQLCNNVAIYGGFVGTEMSLDERDVAANLTVLSGDLQQDDSQQPIITNISTVTGTGNNAYTVVNGSGTDNTARIDGFTVTAGNSNTGPINIVSNYSGGGFFLDNGSPNIWNVTIVGNFADTGGGIYNFESHPTLRNVTIAGNTAGAGGGIFNEASNPILTNGVISGNSAANAGGMVNLVSNPILTNVTISGNSANDFAGGMFNQGGNPTLTNVIIWNNRENGSTVAPGASIVNNSATPIINNSIIANFAPVGTNKNVDPLFLQDVDPSTAPTTAGDLRIQFTSPAINMGDNSADLDGAGGGTATIATIATDLEGKPRILQTTVDIGAYEQVGCPSGLSDQIIYVDAANTSPGDGSDWANALNHLQDALELACECSEITEVWVAAGTYYPDEGLNQTDNDRSSTFQLCDNVAIYGGFSGTETILDDRDVAANLTVLSGDLQQDDSQQPIITNLSTVTGTGNNAYTVVNGSGTDNTAIIDGFTVTAGNSDDINFNLINRAGAGVWIEDGSPNISNISILGNRSISGGGGLYNERSNPILTNLTISGNSTSSSGGGVYNSFSNAVFINTIISGNRARDGGGIFNDTSNPTLINLSISGNYATFGGGIFNDGSDPTLNNVIIWNNSENGNITDARSSIVDDGSSISTINNSIIANSGGGGTNKDVDPLFNLPVNPANAPTTAGDLRLQPTSPAINMGNNAADIDGAGGTMTIADIATDLEGNPRIQQTTVDMGAYEQLGCPDSGSDLKIFVNAANATPGDGSDWTNAFDNLQDALRLACGCSEITEIWVAAGTYYPDEGFGQTDNDRSSTFQLCDNVAIYGGFSGTETSLDDREVAANLTVLSGDLQQDDSQQPIITNLSTVTGTENNAYTVVNGSGTDNTAIIDGFTVTAGNANGAGAISNNRGGGFFIDNGSPKISQVAIFGNNSSALGGGIYNNNSNPILTNIIISGNTATNGGGMLNESSDPILMNMVVSGNSSSIFGGGIYNFSSNPILTNIVISGNSALNGGGIFNEFSNSVLTNVIIWNNQANGSTANPEASILNSTSSTVITYSLVQNITTNADNNIDGATNPLFVNPLAPGLNTGGDYRLQPTSPAINTGNNAADIDGGGGMQTIADIATDLAGEVRIQQTTVDMGAYEQLGCPSGLTDQVLYVNAANASPGDGSNWTNALNILQDALELACACSEITQVWVAAGTYYPDEGLNQVDNDRVSTFQLCNNVSLYGGFAGTETSLDQRNIAANLTILSGDLQQDDSQGPIITDLSTVTGTGNNAYTVVNGSGTNNTAIIDGFTITAGNSDGGSGAFSLGGGIYINNGSSSISNVSILGNNATDAGGIYIGSSGSRPVLTDVLISGNRATFGGGGAYNSRGNIDLINVLISGNSARFGGGFWTGSSAYSDLINVSISGNNATEAGGVYIEEASLNAVNVTISGNSANTGGGIYNNFGSIVLTNVIIWNNSHSGNTAIPPASILNVFFTPIINNSIIANFAPVGTNKNVDPEFIIPVDPSTAPTTAGDLRLLPTSPAINMGNNAADIDGVGGGMTISDIAIDVASNPRIQQTTVDMGAYEQLGCPSGLTDQILYVNAANASPGDGSDWANALNHLQDALDLACKCSEITEIWVAAGTYYPDEGIGQTDNNRNSTFQLCNNVAVYGGFAGTEDPNTFNLADRDLVTNEAILSGDIDGDDDAFAPTQDSDMDANTPTQTDHLNGDNAYSVVTSSGTDNTAIIDGFTVTAGNANLSGTLSSASGGGIYNNEGNPILMNMIILGNNANVHGGGMYNINANPILTDIVISGNNSNLGGGISNVLASSPILTDVTISGNNALAQGGGMINRKSANPTLTNVLISGNSATTSGGGIHNLTANPTLTNVLISGNLSDFGGGIYNNSESNPIFTNVTISGNSATTLAGGIFNEDSNPILMNVIIWNNSENGNSTIPGASISNSASNPIINHSIIAHSGGSEFWESALGVDGGSNKDIDPNFVMDIDPSTAPTTAGDLRLQPTSPAINMGNNAADIDGGIGMQTIADIATDVASNPRIQQTTVDMGAYEQLGCPDSGSDLKIFVNAANATPGDGSDWTNAFDNLQDALRLACGCSEITEIWVAGGTYYPDEGFGQTDNNRNSTFQLCNNVAVYGGFAGTEDPNTFNLADRDLVTNETILSGDIDQNNILDNANAYTVVNSSGTDNTAIIDGFTVTAGNANGPINTPPNNYGGGIYFQAADPILMNLRILGNRANSGGGIYSNDSNPKLTNVVISGNHGSDSGGGISTYLSNLLLTNVVISGNTTDILGGGIYDDFFSNLLLTNVVISGNRALAGGAIAGNASDITLTNVIVWNNHTNPSIVGSSSLEITYSLVENFTTNADNNIDGATDPLFVSPLAPGLNTGGDYRLQPTSPAINMGNNAADIDGAGGMLTISDITTDVAGNPRIQQTTVDMGAYEQLSCAGLIPAATATNQDVATNTVTLDGNNPGDGAGEWSIISGDGNAYFGNTPGTLTASDPTSSFTGTLGQVYTLEWEITLGDCESSTQVMITFNCNAVVASATNQDVSTNTVTLDGNDPGEGTGEWSIISGDGNGYFGNTPGTLTASDPTSSFTGTHGQTYTLEWEITLGDCESSTQVMITFNCDAVLATATSQEVAALTLTLDGNDPGDGTGQWSIISGDGNGYFGDTPGTLTTNNPISTFTGTPRQAYTLEWKIIEGKCENSTQITITILEIEEIPLFASLWGKLGMVFLLIGLMSLLLYRRYV